MKSCLWIGILCIFLGTAAAQPSKISFAESKPIIDGKLDEWEFTLDFTDPNQPLRYRNTNKAAWSWDDEYLYIAFKIKDACLTENESGNDNPRLYFNDAIEFYIDTHDDSDAKMDLNDYQFIVSLKGESVIFKGDKEQIKEGNSVPKDFGIANIVFKAKATTEGSINNLEDIDQGYNIEIALPWSAIGIVPEEHHSFKLDLCVDDIDTVANFKPWPDEYSPPSMHFVNLKGKSDFGFPKDWTEVVLIGSPSNFYLFKQALKEYSILVILVSLFLLAALIVLIIIQYRKIVFLKNMPTRMALLKEEKTGHGSLSTQIPFPFIQPHQESIMKAKAYIEQNIESDISIDQLSRQLLISPRQLQRLFREEIDLTPKQFITIIRLEKASGLLSSGKMSISEIAFETGFSDPAYFTNVFKRYFGLPPSSYGKA